MSNSSKGVIYKIGDTQQISEKFQKREIILHEDSNSEYPNYLSLELTQADVNKADELSVGDRVEVEYFLNGRLWTPKDGGDERCFVTLKLAKIEVLEMSGRAGGGGASASVEDARSAAKNHKPSAPAANTAPPVDEEVDELPF